MSIVKQKSVSSSLHAKNLRNYINDKSALMRDSQNLLSERGWYREMDETRDYCGHNKAARKGFKNTIMYHQIIAFLPEEADINGGIMTPEKCMAYAKEYAQNRYPNQQIAFALHKEHCKNDDTERYAVHMAINRSNLETGNRLDEGRSKSAKCDRAKSIRELDSKWGLQEVEKDKPNSKIHARQPRGAEKAIVERGGESYKSNLRELVKYASEKATNMKEFRDFLASWDVKTTIKNKKVYAIDVDNDKYVFSVPRLESTLTMSGLNEIFERKSTTSTTSIVTDFATTKKEYQEKIEAQYRNYCKEAKLLKGTDYNDFPQIKLTHPGKELMKDTEIRREVLSYIRRADDLRLRLASNTPIAATQDKNTPHGSKQGYSNLTTQRGKQQEIGSNKGTER